MYIILLPANLYVSDLAFTKLFNLRAIVVTSKKNNNLFQECYSW